MMLFFLPQWNHSKILSGSSWKIKMFSLGDTVSPLSRELVQVTARFCLEDLCVKIYPLLEVTVPVHAF